MPSTRPPRPTQTPSEPGNERPLGATEEMFWRLDDTAPINFVIHSLVRGPLDEEILRKALDAVQDRHPKLRLWVEDRGHQVPWYRSGTGPIPLRVVHGTPEDGWQELMGEATEPLDTARGPLLRCTWVWHGDSESTLLLTFHHSISDGKSGAFILRDLLEAASQAILGRTPRLEPLPPLSYCADQFPPDVEGVGHLRSAARMVRQLGGAALRSGFPHGVSIEKFDPLWKQKPYVHPRFLGPEVTRALVKAAKANDTTVHGALFAALALAVYEESGRTAPMSLACASAIDLRNKVDPPVEEDCGYFVAGVASIHKVGPGTELWPLAARIRKGIDDAIDMKMHFLLMPNPHRSFAWLGRVMGKRFSGIYGELIHAMHPGNLLLSNIGRFDFGTRFGPFEIETIGFAGNNSAMAYFNSAAATIAGRLTWTFVGSQPLVSPERVRRIGDRAVELLLGALGLTAEAERGASQSPETWSTLTPAGSKVADT